jgi:DNA replicative helicase MCM subunit Mcm2 (Cdc46/Mcm family)
VLLREENVESFEWDLTEFAKMMGGKHAVTVLTCNTFYSLVGHADVKHGFSSKLISS